MLRVSNIKLSIDDDKSKIKSSVLKKLKIKEERLLDAIREEKVLNSLLEEQKNNNKKINFFKKMLT